MYNAYYAMNEMLQAWTLQEKNVFDSKPIALANSMLTHDDGCAQQNQDQSYPKTIEFIIGKPLKVLLGVEHAP